MLLVLLACTSNCQSEVCEAWTGFLFSTEPFLGDQRLSYGQPLTLTFHAPPGGTPPPLHLRLEGAGLAVSLRRSHLSSSLREAQLSFL